MNFRVGQVLGMNPSSLRVGWQVQIDLSDSRFLFCSLRKRQELMSGGVYDSSHFVDIILGNSPAL